MCIYIYTLSRFIDSNKFKCIYICEFIRIVYIYIYIHDSNKFTYMCVYVYIYIYIYIYVKLSRFIDSNKFTCIYVNLL